MYKTISFLMLTTLVVAACNSKYEESSPSQVPLTEGEIAERATLTSLVDSKSIAIEKSMIQLNEAKSLMSSWILGGPAEQDKMVMIIQQANNEFIGQIPRVKDGEATWFATLNTAENTLKELGSDLCVSLKVALGEKPKETPPEKLAYFLFPCSDPSQTTEILRARWVDEKMDLQLFSPRDSSTVDEEANAVPANCTVTKAFTAVGKPEIKCQNISVASEKSDTALAETLRSSPEGLVTLQAKTKVFRDNKYRGTVKITQEKLQEPEVTWEAPVISSSEDK